MTPVKVYKYRIGKIGYWLLPNKLKMPRIIKWVEALTYPFSILHKTFTKFREETTYRLSITPQVVLIEKLLNDRFDYTLRRIYITDPVQNELVFVFAEAEEMPLYVRNESENEPVYIFSNRELNSSRVGAIVWIPISINNRVDEVKSLIDQFKLFGVSYLIQQI